MVNIAPASLPTATVGTAYSETVTVSGHKPPYTVRVTQGALPAGLSLSLGGALTGTPSTAGSFAFTVSAYTSSGTYVAFRDYTLTVANAAAPPPPATVSIAPASLPAATVGTAYSQSVTVSGPNPPYTVRVTQGALPAGLSLSLGGALTGTPSTAGSFAFTVSAYTSSGTYVAFRDYTLTVTTGTGGGDGGAPYFADDFETGLSKWNLWGPSNAFGLVPGWTGQGASLTAGPSTTGPTSSASEMASLWLNWPTAHAGAGMSTWYAAKVNFPTGYQATTGQWNWFMEWHVDDATSTYSGAYSAALGVYTDYPVTPYPGLNPRLAFRVMGGSVTSPQQYVFTLPANSLRLGSWYDIIVHFVWSPDPTVGLAELWLDGQLVVSTHLPTLYSHPNGATSFNYFGLYHYRPKASWDASIHFDRVRIGPTKTSVQ